MKTAMIWGASGGIGRSLTKQLTEAGWQVVAITRHPDKVEDIASVTVELENVGNSAEIDKAIYTAQFEADAIDLWVYAIGDITQAKVANMDADAWRRILDANLTGAYLAAHASEPLLQPDAHLFFLGAVSERLQLPSLSAYVAAKAGLEAFVTTMSKEQRKRKFTIVRPGAVDTDFWDKVSLKKPKDSADPDKIAQRIIAAYESGTKGTLDITH